MVEKITRLNYGEKEELVSSNILSYDCLVFDAFGAEVEVFNITFIVSFADITDVANRLMGDSVYIYLSGKKIKALVSGYTYNVSDDQNMYHEITMKTHRVLGKDKTNKIEKEDNIKLKKYIFLDI
jgi:hypothetical protein